MRRQVRPVRRGQVDGQQRWRVEMHGISQPPRESLRLVQVRDRSVRVELRKQPRSNAGFRYQIDKGYVAKLREVKTDAKPVVFRINMEAGHGGKSGRFQRYKESAEQFAYMLEVLGVK